MTNGMSDDACQYSGPTGYLLVMTSLTDSEFSTDSYEHRYGSAAR